MQHANAYMQHANAFMRDLRICNVLDLNFVAHRTRNEEGGGVRHA